MNAENSRVSLTFGPALTRRGAGLVSQTLQGRERKQHEIWRCGCKADYYQMLLINHSLATPASWQIHLAVRGWRTFLIAAIEVMRSQSSSQTQQLLSGRSWNKQPPLSPFFQSPGTRHLFLSWKVNTSREWVFLYLEKGTQEEAINNPRQITWDNL